jgi:hypothetical protein
MKNEEAYAALMTRDPQWLARPIEELVKIQAVGSVYLATHKELLKKIKSGQIHLAEEDRKSKLADGQAIGEALLDVEVKIGQLLPSADDARAGRDVPLHHARLPKGYNRQDDKSRHKAQYARALAANPAAVAAIKAEARQNEDIPTKTAVLNRIKLEAMEKKVARMETVVDRDRPDINAVIMDVYNKLGDCYAKIAQIYKHQESILPRNRDKIQEVVEQIYEIVRQ